MAGGGIMSRRDIGTDDHRVKVRPGKGSRPRTKIRPDYSKLPRGQVIRVDRGRYHVRTLDSDVYVVAVKARELPHGSVVVGDICALNGDLSGKKDTLARIVSVDPRRTALRRTSEEGEAAGNERVIVANADVLVIVTAVAQPEPRLGMIDRCLVAAYDANMIPLLVLTKTDIASPEPLISHYQNLNFQIVPSALTTIDETGKEVLDSEAIAEIKTLIAGKSSVLVGHSGVGKSTLINALIPEADRLTGDVNEVTGRGRHTSTSAMAFDLPGGGTVVDTPGVRTFGLAHVGVQELLRGFPDLAELAEECPRGCEHHEGELDCAFEEVTQANLRSRIISFRRLLATVSKPEWA